MVYDFTKLSSGGMSSVRKRILDDDIQKIVQRTQSSTGRAAFN